MAHGLAPLLSLPLLALCGAAAAQLADPTRPPAAVGAPAEPAADTPAKTAGLQSVILRKDGKPAALINGEVVELGGMIGEAKVVRIDEDAVLLRGPQGDETLRLTPGAEKKTPAAGTAQQKIAPQTGKEKNR